MIPKINFSPTKNKIRELMALSFSIVTGIATLFSAYLFTILQYNKFQYENIYKDLDSWLESLGDNGYLRDNLFSQINIGNGLVLFDFDNIDRYITYSIIGFVIFLFLTILSIILFVRQNKRNKNKGDN